MFVEGEGMQELSALSAQFYCEPKSFLKKNLYLRGKVKTPSNMRHTDTSIVFKMFFNLNNEYKWVYLIILYTLHAIFRHFVVDMKSFMTCIVSQRF